MRLFGSVLLFGLTGAVSGLLLTVVLCFLFIDADMLLLPYIGGMVVGACVGVTLGIARWRERHLAAT